MKKRLLALLLTLTLCLTLLPAAALAGSAPATGAPAKVITSGIKYWWDLTAPGETNFVANRFAGDCAYYLNDTRTGKNEVADAAAKRGTVVEFYTNANGEISTVKAYEYTAALQEGEVVLVCKLDQGDGTYRYTREKAEKITGKVVAFSTKGELRINGIRYLASEQMAEDGVSEFVVSEELFSNWSFRGGSMTEEYDFYLDKNGSIVAIRPLNQSVGTSKVCVVSDIRSFGSDVLPLVLLFTDGTIKNVTISKLNGRSVVAQVTQADSQISIEDARQALGVPATRFFSYVVSDDGYELTELNAAEASGDWKDPVTLGDGSAQVATVVNESRFAKALGTTSNLKGWNIIANENTRFILCQRNEQRYTACSGFRMLHATDVTKMSAICTNTSGQTAPVARFVYLETERKQTVVKPEPKVPSGYILIRSNVRSIDPELAEDGVYVVDIVDEDGREATMRVTEELGKAIGADSMVVNAKRNYVGRFLTVGGMDKNGVVTSLIPAVALDDVVAMGNGVITLSGHAYQYDDKTQCVYVDIGWRDGEQQGNNFGVLEPELDEISYSGADTFFPNGFFNENDVKPDGTATYTSVRAVVIPADADKTLADWVYVLRTLDIPVEPLIPKPSTVPSATPTVKPSTAPSTTPSAVPTAKPSASPSVQPSATPSAPPSASPVPVTGVSLNRTSVSLNVGKTTTLTATVKPSNATNKAVKWTSTDPVTVNQNGKVTARQVGTAIVTVTTLDGNFTAKCTVTVTKATSSVGGGGGGGSSGGSGGGGGGGAAAPVTTPSAQPSAQPSAKPVDTTKPASENFTDVAKDSWYESGVTYVVKKGLFNGVADKTFAPQQDMTRAMLVTVLARLDGQNTTGGANWYTKGADWAKKNGISDGALLDQSVTREQLVTMLYRYAKATKADDNLAKFTDAAKVSPWAQDAMTWAVGKGILTGKDGSRLDPQGTATRAEVATILQRFVEKK